MKQITLSLIIPTFNENGRINKTLKSLQQMPDSVFCGMKLEQVIFVDDGSTDETVANIKREKGKIEKHLKAKVTILHYLHNKGRGYAIRHAVLASKTDYAIYADADFSIPLSNLASFAPYMNKGYDLIFGSKKKPGAKELIKRSTIRRIVGYGHSILASLILGVTAWDYQGGFKVFSKKLINSAFPYLTINRWGFDMEIIFLAKKLKFKTQELPVVWGHIEQNSKVKLARDIYRSIYEMAKIKYNWLSGKHSPIASKVVRSLAKLALYFIFLIRS